jgi:hypothetical protein
MNPKRTGEALRDLQLARSKLRKARDVMRQARGGARSDRMRAIVLEAGWSALREAHAILAAIPLEAADEDVMTRQLAVERYATSLLVRLRRVLRNDWKGGDDESDDEDGDDGAA